MIYWAGKSSDDVRAIVQYYPDVPRPQRKYSTSSIPGRNGDLLFLEDAYENYTQSYDIYISAEFRGLPKVAQGVAEWLYAPKGYQRLEDSYELEVFRLAYYVGPTDIANVLRRFGTATIEFACKPQRFFKAGERALSFDTPGSLNNAYGFAAAPLITVYGTGAGTVTVGSRTVTINAIDEYVVLDCDLQNAYKGLENKNLTISAPEFPRLEPGENPVSWTGAITRLEIVPRWWTL